MRKTALDALEEIEIARRDLWLAIVRALRLESLAARLARICDKISR